MKTKRAFTLIEVLIAMVIFIIVIIAFVAVETGNIKFGAQDKYKVQANGIAQEGMNIVKSMADQQRTVGAPDITTGNCPNLDTCAAGIYYIHIADQSLYRCKDDAGNWSTDQKVCANMPNEDVITIDKKDFRRTIKIAD